jgi:hypothetical protein
VLGAHLLGENKRGRGGGGEGVGLGSMDRGACARGPPDTTRKGEWGGGGLGCTRGTDVQGQRRERMLGLATAPRQVFTRGERGW